MTAFDPDAILERTQWDFFWLPADVHVVERPELLYTRSPRDIPGLNVVTRTRPARDSDIPALVAEVAEAHRGKLSRWMVTPASRSDALERALTGAGYTRQHDHVASVVDTETFEPRPHPGITAHRVTTLERLRDWFSVSEAAFNRPAGPVHDVAYLERELANCSLPTGRVHRFIAYDGAGAPLAAAGLSSFPSLAFGFLWGGGTVPDGRHRGAYSAVLAARVRWAEQLGVGHVGLYARVETSAHVVRRQGFSQHGVMTYWERPARQD